MQNDHRGSGGVPLWTAEELEAREHGVWIARLVSNILAAGWSGFWMALACVLGGALGTLLLVQRHPPQTASRSPTPAPVAVMSTASTEDRQLQALRAEVASLRELQAAQETRERLERTLAAADLRRAEEAREQVELLRIEEHEQHVAEVQSQELACDPVQDPSALAMVPWPPIAGVMPPPAMVMWPAPPPVVEFQAMAMQQALQAMAYRQLTMWPR